MSKLDQPPLNYSCNFNRNNESVFTFASNFALARCSTTQRAVAAEYLKTKQYFSDFLISTLYSGNNMSGGGMERRREGGNISSVN